MDGYIISNYLLVTNIQTEAEPIATITTAKKENVTIVEDSDEELIQVSFIVVGYQNHNFSLHSRLKNVYD